MTQAAQSPTSASHPRSSEGPGSWRLEPAQIDAILDARCGDPFAILGLHETREGFTLRVFAPGAETLEALTPEGGLIAGLERIRPEGLFEELIASTRFAYRLRARAGDRVWEFLDPYGFGPALGPLDDHLLVEGEHHQLYRRLGAHVAQHEGAAGTVFAVWAPNARSVAVVGDFNAWDGRRNPMRKRIDSGIWEIFLPGVGPGATYKFEIVGPDGALVPLKADPFGRCRGAAACDRFRRRRGDALRMGRRGLSGPPFLA